MTDSTAAIRRVDRLGRLAMLVAGLAAQGAMWSAGHHACYPTAAGLLLFVTAILVAERRARTRAGRRLAAVGKLGACAGLIGACAGEVVAAALRGGNPPSTTEAVGAVLVIAQLVQTAMTSSRRDVMLGAPLVAAMLVQAGAAAADFTPTVPFGVAVAAGITSLALLHRAEQLSCAAVTGEVIAPIRRALAQVGGAAACGVLAFVVLPTSAHVGVHIEKRPTVATSGALDLRARAPLSGTPVFISDAAAPAYWQGDIYDHYDGTTWTVTPSQTTTWSRDDAASDGITMSQVLPEADRTTGPRSVVARTDDVEVMTAQPLNVVFAPGQAVSYVGAGAVSSDAAGNVTLNWAGAAARQSYQVESIQPAIATAELASATGVDLTDSRWLQVPVELPTRVATLAAQVAAGAKNRAATVTAVDDFLRDHETYDLAAPVPAAGVDSVDDFLFVSHRGFCAQFASAAVVMLRTLGIPARLVTGYAHGDTTGDPGKTVFRASDAHAWIQVWYPGVGWVNSDPTPPVPTAASSGQEPTVAAAPAKRLGTPLGALLEAVRHASRPTGRNVALLAALIASVAGMFGLLAALRRRPMRAKPATGVITRPPATQPGPVLAAYLRLADSFSGDAASAAGETMREAAIRLGALTTSTPQAVRALDLLERECYGADPLSAEEVAAAITAFTHPVPS